MNIKCYIIAWNESQLIRHTLNHYKIFCSDITVYDNCSSDGMTDIIRREYPDVKIIPFRTGNSIDEREYLKIKNNCWKKSDADWVIVCDADELLWHQNLPEALQKLKQSGATLPLVAGYNMISENFPNDYTRLLIDQVQLGVRAREFDKQLIFSPKDITEINYRPGAHSCFPAGMLSQVAQPVLFLLHYKYLGKSYLQARHKAYAQRLSGYNKKNKYGQEYTLGTQYISSKFNELNAHKVQIIQ